MPGNHRALTPVITWQSRITFNGPVITCRKSSFSLVWGGIGIFKQCKIILSYDLTKKWNCTIRNAIGFHEITAIILVNNGETKSLESWEAWKKIYIKLYHEHWVCWASTVMRCGDWTSARLVSLGSWRVKTFAMPLKYCDIGRSTLCLLFS